jgi:hypothetical protein
LLHAQDELVAVAVHTTLVARGLPARSNAVMSALIGDRRLGDVVANDSLSTKGHSGWAAVRKQLDSFNRASLLALVHELYDANASNRRFLEARLLTSSMSIEKYRRLVADAVYPHPFSRRQVSIRDATASITEYRRATTWLELST